MAAERKLKGEIDKTLKKVAEGQELFEDLWDQVNISNACDSTSIGGGNGRVDKIFFSFAISGCAIHSISCVCLTCHFARHALIYLSASGP